MFVRSIGRCLVNNVGFNLHDDDCGATIRPVKMWSDYPKRYWLTFDTLEEAEEYLERVGQDREGADLVQRLKDVIL